MNSMRSLVRSVISDVDPSREMFSDTTMQTFFSEVKVLVGGAFGALEHEVQSVTDKSDEWKKRAMERGLMFMADRANENTIIDSIAETDDVCQSLTNLYFSAMHSFVRDRVSKRDMMNMNYEPFGKFIARLYRQIASDNVMKHEYFKTMSYTDKDKFLADMLRQVMQKSVSWPSSHKPFSTPLTPDDSVSNICKPDSTVPAPSRAPSRVGSVVGSVVASRVGESVARVVTAAATENPSRFSAFKPASVVALKPKMIPVTMDHSRTGKNPSVTSCVSNE